MLSDLELMRLHVEAEFTHDAAGDLVSTNESFAKPAPRFFLGHTLEERLLRDNLPGYRAYAKRVQHRLVPGLW